ncbi:hypothetical protein DSL72_003185 [Monilinia vaccinii-corymbosi]|uniref:Uncharacterized protein n=1 Tax=Monilinia vaccinii-corymbosi TaxID=61207 RepID=A0A8A3NSJ9_9HELO|nr:hypothetical protein DSL72_003185 [Monilinia vaccinii-corymbosi]
MAFKGTNRSKDKVDGSGTAKVFAIFSIGNASNRVAALGVKIHWVFSRDSRSSSTGIRLINSRTGNKNRDSSRSANRQNSRR